MTMYLSSPSFILMFLIAIAACDVNYYPYFGRTVVAGGGQILSRRPIVQPTRSANRIVVLNPNYAGLGGIVPGPVMPVPNVIGSAVVIGSDSYDSSDIFSDDRVVLIG